MTNFNLSPVFCAHNNVIILEQADNCIVIGILDTTDKNICNRIEERYVQFLRCNSPTQINKDSIHRFITYKEISQDYFIRETSRRFAINHEQALTMPSEKHENLEYLIEDAPIIHLLNSLLLECVEKHGSDIHIEPFDGGSRVRMRILGELEMYSVIDTKTATALILRILFLANLDITETRRSQDGAFHFEAGTIETEVRASVLPSKLGLSCVLRLLSCKMFDLSFSGLGFLPFYKDFLEDVCFKTNALFLVCGATGAGKSTTLAAILHRISENKRKIITIEDPVEYKVDGVVQIPVNVDLDMDFPQVLRSTFRHDPDVIMVGEIRDEKTARIAIRAALTGHLVLASIHAGDAPSAVIRLLDMGIEHWLLASVFGGALCQRLVRRSIEDELCYIPIAEVLPSCKDISRLILEKASLDEYREWMEKNGIENMHEEKNYVACI